MYKIKVQGDRFVDELGRHVILHGINLNCKNKDRGYIGDWCSSDFQKMKQWGFNVIRLGIIWDGIEPFPGQYDDAYLEKVRTLIRLAHQQDLYVFLDMHQDLYSSLFSDGAPSWATITDEEVYTPSDLWSEAYWSNGAVQRAFDHFWNNSLAADGIGIQDHIIAAWAHVVKQLGKEPNVIGYDLLNEPSMGSEIQKMIEALLSSYARISASYTGQEPPSPEDLSIIWDDPDRKKDMFLFLNQPAFFAKLMDSVAPMQAKFEHETLSEFYRKSARAIREFDPHGIIFLETNYMANAGISSAITFITNKQGDKDGQQAYAPHGYDLVTDSDEVHAPDNRRVDFIFQRHEETRSRLELPMLIGEWGAYMESEMAEEASLHVKGIFERLLCSDTYWLYHHPNMDQYTTIKGICRGYPMAVSGKLISYSYESADSCYTMQWIEDENTSNPTKIYLPNIVNVNLHVEKNTGIRYSIEEIEGCHGGYLYIEPSNGGMRTLQIG